MKKKLKSFCLITCASLLFSCTAKATEAHPVVIKCPTQTIERPKAIALTVFETPLDQKATSIQIKDTMRLKYRQYPKRSIVSRSLKNVRLKKIMRNAFEDLESKTNDNGKRIVAYVKCASGKKQELGNIFYEERDSYYKKTLPLNCATGEHVHIYLQRPVFEEEGMTAEVHFIITTEKEWEIVDIEPQNQPTNKITVTKELEISESEDDEHAAMLPSNNDSHYYTPRRNQTNLAGRLQEIFCENCLCKFCKDLFGS